MKEKMFLTWKMFLMVIGICAFLSGCGEIDGYSKQTDGTYANDNPVAMVLILGRHANAMAIPADAYDIIGEFLEPVVYGGYVCAIVSDGSPTKVDLTDEKDFFTQDARNTDILKKRIKTRTQKLKDSLSDINLSADTPQTDLLGALREARNVLTSTAVKNTQAKKIVILDTGLATTGDLNLLNINLRGKQPEISEVVAQLNDYRGVGVLPDLKGIEVVFIGANDGTAEVAEPQKLGTADKKYVKNLWEGIVRACGAINVSFENVAGWNEPNVYTEDVDSKFPFVSSVEFDNAPIIELPVLQPIDPNSPDGQPKLPPPPVVDIKLGSEKVAFEPDKSEYLQGTDPKRELAPYAEVLKKFFALYPTEKIWIVGGTATTIKNGEGDVGLALRRAERVKTTLIDDFGVSSNNLLVIGLGAIFPWHVDEFPNGSFDTYVAQSNRAVWLLSDHEDNEKFVILKEWFNSSRLLPESIEQFSLNSKE